MAHTLHTLILAGGSGTRFWPLSREQSPKQLLDVFGEPSLMVRTIERALSVMDEQGTINIVVGESLLDEVRNHLKAQPSLKDVVINYIVEPCARNTAPAIALGASTIKMHDSEALVLMLPSDHRCANDEAWRAVVRSAVVRAHAGDLVTIGLTPTRPETGYGYIVPGEERYKGGNGDPAVYAVNRFAEKPDATSARALMAAGALWNSGMLIASARAIEKELRLAGAMHPDGEHTVKSGQMASVGETLADMGPLAYTQPIAEHLYGMLPAEPFDKAVLEVSEHVSVVPASLDWNDVGSLTALEDLAESDARGNRLLGHAVDVDSRNTLVYARAGENLGVEPRLVATLGLEDAVVVDTPDATLVAAKDRVQDVRAIVAQLKEHGSEECVTSRTSRRPWGTWSLLVRGSGFQVKEVDVLPGTRLSLQSHTQRAEHWIVIAGVATVTRDDETITLNINESVFLPIGCKHRLANEGTEKLRVIEVATGAYLGEDDIERYEDDFGRN